MVEPRSNERLGHADVRRLKAVAFAVSPVFELCTARYSEVGEERSLVECRGFLVLVAGNASEEIVAIVAELEREREVAACAEDRFVAECLAELEDRLAECAESALGFGVGPEQVDEVLSGCGSSVVGREIDEESERLAGPEDDCG